MESGHPLPPYPDQDRWSTPSHIFQTGSIRSELEGPGEHFVKACVMPDSRVLEMAKGERVAGMQKEGVGYDDLIEERHLSQWVWSGPQIQNHIERVTDWFTGEPDLRGNYESGGGLNDFLSSKYNLHLGVDAMRTPLQVITDSIREQKEPNYALSREDLERRFFLQHRVLASSEAQEDVTLRRERILGKRKGFAQSAHAAQATRQDQHPFIPLHIPPRLHEALINGDEEGESDEDPEDREGEDIGHGITLIHEDINPIDAHAYVNESYDNPPPHDGGSGENYEEESFEASNDPYRGDEIGAALFSSPPLRADPFALPFLSVEAPVHRVLFMGTSSERDPEDLPYHEESKGEPLPGTTSSRSLDVTPTREGDPPRSVESTPVETVKAVISGEDVPDYFSSPDVNDFLAAYEIDEDALASLPPPPPEGESSTLTADEWRQHYNELAIATSSSLDSVPDALEGLIELHRPFFENSFKDAPIPKLVVQAQTSSSAPSWSVSIAESYVDSPDDLYVLLNALGRPRDAIDRHTFKTFMDLLTGSRMEDPLDAPTALFLYYRYGAKDLQSISNTHPIPPINLSAQIDLLRLEMMTVSVGRGVIRINGEEIRAPPAEVDSRHLSPTRIPPPSSVDRNEGIMEASGGDFLDVFEDIYLDPSYNFDTPPRRFSSSQSSEFSGSVNDDGTPLAIITPSPGETRAERSREQRANLLVAYLKKKGQPILNERTTLKEYKRKYSAAHIWYKKLTNEEKKIARRSVTPRSKASSYDAVIRLVKR